MVKQLLATKDITVNIGGIEYDCLLIPKTRLMDIDYSDIPEEDPRVLDLISKIRNKEI